MNALINSMGEILSQCMSNQHADYFDYLTIFFINYISVQLAKMKKWSCFVMMLSYCLPHSFLNAQRNIYEIICFKIFLGYQVMTGLSDCFPCFVTFSWCHRGWCADLGSFLWVPMCPGQTILLWQERPESGEVVSATMPTSTPFTGRDLPVAYPLGPHVGLKTKQSGSFGSLFVPGLSVRSDVVPDPTIFLESNGSTLSPFFLQKVQF